jgi:hypothetical protein
MVVRLLPGAALVLLSLLPSSSPYIGDTVFYADAVVRHLAGEASGPFAPLWEFGHLLWRPIGAVIAPLAFKVVPDSWGPSDRVKVAYGFLAISMACAIVVGALLYDLFRRAAGWKVAALLVFGLSWANGFLMYALSGSSYLPALLCSVVALCLLLDDPSSPWRQYVAGILGGLSALFWFPFVLTVPAIALTPWIWRGMPARAGGVALLRVSVAAAACVASFMVAGGFAAGVRSMSDARAWVQDASHEWAQTQQWKRAVSGVPRLMLDLSRDGILLKRYVLRDPFQSLDLWDLLLRSAWKLAAFYAFIAATLWMASGSVRGRRSLATTAIAGAPLLLFALVLFEPSSPERFLPVLPFLLLTIAVSWHGPARVIVAVFLVTLPLMNASAFIERLSDTPGMMVAQMEDVERSADAHDLIVTITFNDPFPQWVEQRIFHASMRHGSPSTYQLIEPSVSSALRWRERFAERVLRHWDAGGNVWVRRGGLHETPDPMLQWVEGDNPDIRWADVPAFLRQFEYDRESSRPDGFVRLTRSLRSREALEAIRRVAPPG